MTLKSKQVMLLNVILLFCFMHYSSTIVAQEFRVQIAAFVEDVPLSYFEDAGLSEVYMNTDQNNIYRYYVGNFMTRLEAEKEKEVVIEKGFQYAQVIDIEEQRALCGMPCPFFSSSTTYMSDSKENLYLNSIFFGFDKSSLELDERKKLDKLYKILEESPNVIVQVIGHTDSKGSPEYNLALSKRRARAARNYLISKGLPAYRIKAKVFGEAAPVAINTEKTGKDSPEGRKYNRRVVIAILNPEGGVVMNTDTKIPVPKDLKINQYPYILPQNKEEEIKNSN